VSFRDTVLDLVSVVVGDLGLASGALIGKGCRSRARDERGGLGGCRWRRGRRRREGRGTNGEGARSHTESSRLRLGCLSRGCLKVGRRRVHWWLLLSWLEASLVVVELLVRSRLAELLLGHWNILGRGISVVVVGVVSRTSSLVVTWLLVIAMLLLVAAVVLLRRRSIPLVLLLVRRHEGTCVHGRTRWLGNALSGNKTSCGRRVHGSSGLRRVR